MDSPITRRVFVGALTALGFTAAQDGWVQLFDGHSLNGWRPSETKDSWKVIDGQLAADGPRSHLFYNGNVNQASFLNFELEVEALAKPSANSGVYFHTAYQETNFPQKGFEVQVNNTAGAGERKKTGSLYGFRNVYKEFVKDDEWFKLNVLVRGKNVQVRLNGMLVVDYTEPATPFVPTGIERERFLQRGTFALQCHDPNSKARFRSVRVRPLPDSTPTPGPLPEADDTFKRLIQLSRDNYPVVDFHTHLKGLTLEQALEKSRRDGIEYGIAVNCGKGFPTDTDAAVMAYVDSMKGQPCFVAMQAEGREWTQMFSRRAAAQFDYIFTDSMTWTDNHGKRMRTWMPNEVGTISDPQEFMDTLVDRAVGILENEPVDIYVNPTFLPDAIARDYETLWTDARRKRVIAAAKANNVAIEINDRYKLPSRSFIEMAKAEGCKFSFGTNNAGAADLRRSEYGLQMIDECKLRAQDFFVPGAFGPRAIERKGNALKA